MKNKLVTVILGIALVISIGINIYLFNNVNNNRAAVSAFSSQLTIADEQIGDMQKKLNDLEKLEDQVSDLQDQLSENEIKKESLEAALVENNAAIADLEGQVKKDVAQLKSGQVNQDTTPQSAYDYVPNLEDDDPFNDFDWDSMEVIDMDASQLGEGGSGIGDGLIWH